MYDLRSELHRSKTPALVRYEAWRWVRFLAVLCIALSGASAAAEECDLALCECSNPPACTSCAINRAAVLTDGCVLDWGETTDVTITANGKLKIGSVGHCSSSGAPCNVDTGGGCPSGQSCYHNGFCLMARNLTVRGELDGGVNLGGLPYGIEFIVEGNLSFQGSGQVKGDFASYAVGDTEILDTAYIAGDVGGSVDITGAGNVTITSSRTPTIEVPHAGDVVIDTTEGSGDITIGPNSVVDVSESANGDFAGSIGFESGGDIVVEGVLRANGSGTDTDGGDIDISTYGQGNISIPGQLNALGKDEGNDGTITVGPACNINISGTLDTKRTGFNGSNTLKYRTSLTVTGTLEADPVFDDAGGNEARCHDAGGHCETNPSIDQSKADPDVPTPPTLDTIGPCLGCGNSIFEPEPPYLEQCEDGNVADGDGCAGNCMLCGSGTLNPGEQCDDGNRIDADGCAGNCMLCGSGTLNPGEQCDDGNRSNGDGCDSNCTPTSCGNNVITATEQCDDGNLTAGDGCSAACTLETTFPVNSVVAGKDATQPAIARASNGTFAIVWKDNRNSACTGEVLGNVYANGAYGAAPTVVSAERVAVPCSPFSGDNYYPAIAADTQSRFAITWRRADGTWLGLLQTPAWYHMLASGYPTVTPIPLFESPIAGAVSIFPVATFLWSPPHTILGAISVDSASPPFIGPPNPIGLEAPYGPASSGGLALCSDQRAVWVNNGVMLQTSFSPYGLDTSPPVRVDVGGTPTNGSADCDQRWGSTNLAGTVVVWSDSRSGSARIRGRIMGASPGQFSTGDLALDSGIDNVTPAVAVRSQDGNFAVVWHHIVCGGASTQLRYFNSTGTPIGTEVDYGSAWSGSRPQITALTSGEFVTTWVKDVGGDLRVVARKFSP